MAAVKPFRMVHYNGTCASALNTLITPPYDVISPEEQEKFYSTSPFNIIRLVLGKQYAEDTDRDNRYTRAAETLRKWLADGILVRKDRPGMVIYRMEFDDPTGGRQQLDGIILLVKVDDYGRGKVLPHEKTYKGPKEDQLNLMRHCRSHLTPIHGLFEDKEDLVIGEYSKFMERPPEQEAVDANGTVHKTWFVDDERALSAISRLLAEKSIFIADGHHRYETALAYKKEMDFSGVNVEGAADYVMMYLTSMTHPGLTILPAHRMVRGLPEFDLPAIIQRLDPYFHQEALPFDDNNRAEVSQRLIERIASYSEIGGKFGMVVRGEQSFRLLRLKDFSAVEPLMDSNIPESLRTLDVTILREIIIGHGLGLDKDDPHGQIEYTPSISEALDRVLKGEFQVSFILNPTRVDQMRSAAELGHKLPHKSTYFFPKISSGLALNVF